MKMPIRIIIVNDKVMQASCNIANQNILFQAVVQVGSEDTPLGGHQTKSHFDSNPKLGEEVVERSLVFIKLLMSGVGTQ